MATERIRVFIVDDHPMIRTGLAVAINAEADLTLAGQASSGFEAVRRIPASAAHVVLMDLFMPGMDGVATIEALARSLPGTRFVVLTSAVDGAAIERAIAAGAAGYLSKNASPEELVNAIRAVHAGRRILSPDVTDALLTRRQQPGLVVDLTARERELLQLMTRGLNNQEICAELAIALPTVKFHITNILSKLQVENRTEAVLKAIKHQLVPPP